MTSKALQGSMRDKVMFFNIVDKYFPEALNLIDPEDKKITIEFIESGSDSWNKIVEETNR